MTETKVLDVLQKVGAFRTGHFVLISGRHADAYINKDVLYTHTRDTSHLCRLIAERFKDENIEAVIGPAIGAAILAQWTAYHLSEIGGKEVYGTYADKDGQGGFIIKRGYDQVIKGKRTLVVEDLTTTGGSIKKVVDTARSAGAEVVAAIAIVNRGEVTKEAAGNPPIFESLAKVHLESWPESECVLCERGIPINIDVGHGREFLSRKSA